MTCTNCKTELETGTAFCGACGTRQRRHTMVGKTIDRRFHIDARIAAGGFGAIYRATDLESGCAVALKVLHAELAHDERLAARFAREGAALSSLSNEHVVRTLAVGTAVDGTMYIAMELLRGESLFDRFCREGAMPWRRVVGILRGVCAAIWEAHALGIVHRDLKPANLQLVERGGDRDFVKVLDFGIAKVLRDSMIDPHLLDDGDELTIAGQAIGTLEYMSPEQLVGGDCDGRTDIYTLGVVAYELLTGARPFADATGPTSLITTLLTQAPPPPSTLAASPVPRAIDAIVMRCLERDPADRFSTIDELAAALDNVVARHPATAPVAHVVGNVEIDDEPTWIDRAPHRRAPAGNDVERLPLASVTEPPAVQWQAAWAQPAPAPEPQPFTFDVRGSVVEEPSLPAAPARLGFAKLAGWAAGLLALGVGLGMLVASLAS